MDLVLQIRANIGAGSTALELKAFPERRKLRVFRHTDVALAIGSQIVQGGTAIATLEFQGDLDPGNIDPVPRFFMFNPGRTRNFRIQNLSDEERTFALTITPEGSPIGWDATPDRLPITPTPAGGEDNIPVVFRTSNQAGATSPQTFTLQLVDIAGDNTETPLDTTLFEITFELT